MKLTIDTGNDPNILLKLHYLSNLCALAWDLQANFHRKFKYEDADPVEVIKEFFENNDLPYEVVERFGE